ncbi:uncharacterized protein BO66DRAFT_237426 [Aspergillus aculeatinus CBS 121060]|uniref:Uncharacterized protein n=1 Tax=Aspergillus aculeatinus CBS 121060 TaxID=1448322 RepID=A0ACD1HHT2_9EURO|nr:hypothetical protein BO66DRAFT_237426 [Aspergillus aculeatinus CBS 121060]RAH73203.1 hypothetical protein BO66DRAFT_237426 [Aspergillus aculeatinus CBS 121060]
MEFSKLNRSLEAEDLPSTANQIASCPDGKSNATHPNAHYFDQPLSIVWLLLSLLLLRRSPVVASSSPRLQNDAVALNWPFIVHKPPVPLRVLTASSDPRPNYQSDLANQQFLISTCCYQPSSRCRERDSPPQPRGMRHERGRRDNCPSPAYK